MNQSSLVIIDCTMKCDDCVKRKINEYSLSLIIINELRAVYRYNIQNCPDVGGVIIIIRLLYTHRQHMFCTNSSQAPQTAKSFKSKSFIIRTESIQNKVQYLAVHKTLRAPVYQKRSTAVRNFG